MERKEYGECSSSVVPNPAPLECNTVADLLAFNETYFEIIDAAIANVDQLLKENLEKQKMLLEEQKIYKRGDVQKRKVPVHLYMPPYFKDENGMCPPMSAEAREKQELRWFDPMMKEEKKWTPKEIQTLKDAVREAVIVTQMQPLCSRRDIVVAKLRNQDVNTQNWERREWAHELEELMRKIAYIKSKPGDEVLTAGANYSIVPWNEIANVAFKGTRTEWAVKSKWMNELNPKWSKAPWTQEEMESLRSLRESPHFTSWPLLAFKLGTHRTAYQCMEKYKTELAQHSKEWTNDEDTKLIALTKLTSVNGHIQWDKVAQFMPGRTRQQVRTRFSHTLDSNVKHGRWTDQEDMLLLCSVSRHGAKDWAKVAQAVQNRNDSQCRERWANVLNRSAHVSERFTLVEDEQLLFAVKVFGKGNWAKCQTLLPKKTSKQLRRRYLQLIAAKLRLVAGFSNAVEAMKGGRKTAEENSEEPDVVEEELAPNELMVEAYRKLERERPETTYEAVEAFQKRVNELEGPMGVRLEKMRKDPKFQHCESEIKAIIKKHEKNQNFREISKELMAVKVLENLVITETDVRYMISRSSTRNKYYIARQISSSRSVDKIGMRLRPLQLKHDGAMMPEIDECTSEEEKIMRLVEALCAVLAKHDVTIWGRNFWVDFRSPAILLAREYTEKMIKEKSMDMSNWIANPHGNPRPTKCSLPPSAASFAMLTMVQKARAGLNKLAAEHFYPIDVPLEEQPNFSNEDREKLDEKRRMNIQLSDEVTNSEEYNLFYARMRTILLEPMRLQFARETAEEERHRLQRDIDSEARASEEEAVVDGIIQRPEMPSNSLAVALPTSICRILADGMKIDSASVIASLDEGSQKKITRKRRLDDTISNVAARVLHKPTTSSHISLDTDVYDDEDYETIED